MRTSIFNDFAGLEKRFMEDFELLWSLPADQRNSLIPKVSEIYKARTVGETQAAKEKAIAEIGGNAADLLRSLNLLLFIYKEWNPISDTPQEFLKDLSELGLIPSEGKVEGADTFLINLLSVVQQDNMRRLEKMYAYSMLPSYKGCHTLIDFRVIIQNPFGSIEKDIEEYDPQCAGFVPVILVKITRDSGDPSTFEFQLEEDSLRRLIDHLNAALKDLEAAKLALPRRDR